jgi:hypothetical protein
VGSGSTFGQCGNAGAVATMQLPRNSTKPARPQLLQIQIARRSLVAGEDRELLARESLRILDQRGQHLRLAKGHLEAAATELLTPAVRGRRRANRIAGLSHAPGAVGGGRFRNELVGRHRAFGELAPIL